MKKSLIAAILVCFTFTVKAQIKKTTKDSSKVDTVKVNFGNMKLLMFHDKSEVQDTSKKLAHEIDSVKSKVGSRKKNFIHWNGLSFGVDGYLNKSGGFDVPAGYNYMDLRYSKCINVTFNFFEKGFSLIKNNVMIYTGLGIEWNNYRFAHNTYLKPGAYNFTGVDSSKQFSKSKLVADYITVPLMLQFNTNGKNADKSLHISLGVIGGYMYRAHTKIMWDQDGDDKKYKDFDDFNLSPFKLSASARIGYGSFAFFANYGLTPMFLKGRGPELYPFAVGIAITGS